MLCNLALARPNNLILVLVVDTLFRRFVPASVATRLTKPVLLIRAPCLPGWDKGRSRSQYLLVWLRPPRKHIVDALRVRLRTLTEISPTFHASERWRFAAIAPRHSWSLRPSS